MLHEFLSANRAALIEQCKAKAAQRSHTDVSIEFEYGIPMFLDQLIKTLKIEQTADPMRGRDVSGASGGDKLDLSEIGRTASLHGRELLKRGFTVDQVVHDYGDLCQAVTDMAFETNALIAVDEFRTLNRCLDNGIADAVTEFSSRSEAVIMDKGVIAMNQRLGFLAHELRNHIHTATLAVTAIKTGNVGINGATGAILDRSLAGLRNLVDRSLAEVRLTAGMPEQLQRVPLADFIAEVTVSATLLTHAHDCTLVVAEVDKTLAIEADREMLFSVLGNLLQNAFKFTGHCTEVYLNAYATGERIIINVEDHCGGLPPGAQAKLFQPFSQTGENRSGMGLGLVISRRSVEAMNGVLSVRDRPGSGCVFTIDLPRYKVETATEVAKSPLLLLTQ